jgi:uncharacterized protein YjbI with pentapeptide repeats
MTTRDEWIALLDDPGELRKRRGLEKGVRPDLTRLNLSGRDLSDHLLNQCDLSFSDLSGSKLPMLIPTCRLEGTKLDGATFNSESERETVRLLQLLWTDVPRFTRELTGRANLHGCDLSSADLRGLTLKSGAFVGARLEGARFEGAKLKDIHFLEANLDRATFDDAVIDSCALDNASLRDASFRRAQLRFTSALEIVAPGSHWDQVTGQTFNVGKGKLSDAVFDDATLSGFNAIQTELSGASFAGVRFKKANFMSASLQRAKFNRAHCEEVSFKFADVAETDFREVSGTLSFDNASNPAAAIR